MGILNYAVYGLLYLRDNCRVLANPMHLFVRLRQHVFWSEDDLPEIPICGNVRKFNLRLLVSVAL